MKIAVFSDIHGNQFAFREFLNQVNSQNINRFYFLGDVFGYYYGQNECLELLRQIPEIICIKGNHDEFFLQYKKGKVSLESLADKFGSTYLRSNEIARENEDFLCAWNIWHEERIDGMRVGFFHGTPDNPLNGRLYPDTPLPDIIAYKNYDVIFLGHTHHKMKREIGTTVVCNPGSIGQQRDGKGCSYILFDTGARKMEYKIVTYDLKPLLKQIEKYDPNMPALSEVLTRKVDGTNKS